MVKTNSPIASLLFLILLTQAACCESNGPREDIYYEKYVELGNAPLEDKVAMAARLVPSAAQLAWQRWELTAFIHFTVNTFTGQEWGDGRESPDIFLPTALDTDQWAETLKDAGFKMVMLTAKHHDGFCLWPTETTRHSVKYSSWMDGCGDVVGMLRASCDKYGLKMGVYISPWDRNAMCYGTGKAYDDFFVAQLTELLTRYGPISEVWFDGANGSAADGKHQVYDWMRYVRTVKELQPDAVTAIKGDDIRWVGNEKGIGRVEEWSAAALAPTSVGLRNPSSVIKELTETSPDLGSRAILAEAKELFWYPAEVDVSIRPGWFYHVEEDAKVKTLEEMKEIYFASVGSNSVLLLNIPPDRRGLFHDIDTRRLLDFGDWVRRSFSENRVFGGDMLWIAGTGESKIFDVAEKTFNVVMLQEEIAKGQRVERFRVEISENGIDWLPLVSGTTIGYKRLIRLPESHMARKIRILIEQSRSEARIAAVGLFYAE